MAKRVTISEHCPGADYTKALKPSPADLVSDFRIECLTVEDLVQLSAGIVPLSVQSSALRLLDFEELLRRNAQKPAKGKARNG